MEKVVIASKNPVKIQAVKNAFKKVFPNRDFEFITIPVSSNVADQPSSDRETLLGAQNRVKNALNKIKNADFYIGMEGGIECIKSEMKVFAWIFIKSNNKEGKAKTGSFFLPEKIIHLINEGKELGEADDIIFNRHNSKQENGVVGILTGDIIDRTKLCMDAVILALIPFKNPDLY